jgi:DNA processing protein
MQIHDVLLHLSLIKGVGPSLVERLCEHIPLEDLQSIYTFTIQDFKNLGVNESNAHALMQGLQNEALINDERALLNKHNIEWISCADERYPPQLKEIHLPPLGLYVRGSLKNITQSLAIVGSRKAQLYAQRVINSLVPPLVNNGWTIVSGGALGADGMAHRATLAAGGNTIVVLGSGILKPYPTNHSQLFEDIVKAGGALVSSFSLMTSPHAGNFPARNRIIAGLSRGCVVVQAAQESGAAITAHYALEQGREVFAVPGAIDDELSAGCHALIQQGAQLVTCADDIMRAFEFKTLPTALALSKNLIDSDAVSKNDFPKENMQESVIENCSVAQKILTACKYPCSLDELVEKLELDVLTA